MVPAWLFWLLNGEYLFLWVKIYGSLFVRMVIWALHSLILQKWSWINWMIFIPFHVSRILSQNILAVRLNINYSRLPPVLCLVDLIGGMPCNQCIRLSQHYDLQIVSGVNLPMLLELNDVRNEYPLSELIKYCLDVVSTSSKDVLSELNQ